MAFYADEEDVWKCPKHPSKHRRSGICAACLRDRLAILCPECANVRPCACCATAATTSSSSSSSSSFSRSFSRFSTSEGGVGSFGRVSNLIESEPAFRRSRSVAIPVLRSWSQFVGNETEMKEPSSVSGKSKASSFWSVFKSQKSKNVETNDGSEKKAEAMEEEDKDMRARRTIMMRSRSVAVPVTSDSRSSGGGESRTRGRSWYFPSPIKVFRQSKIAKVVQQRSPLYRV